VGFHESYDLGFRLKPLIILIFVDSAPKKNIDFCGILIFCGRLVFWDLGLIPAAHLMGVGVVNTNFIFSWILA